MRRILSGRVAIDPIPIPDRRAFIEFLERNATRIQSAIKFQLPLLSPKKGYVFYTDESRILIRHNSDKPLPFVFTLTSNCFLSAKIEKDGTNYVLQGSYRFPVMWEFPRYALLAFAVFWTFYFSFRVILGSQTLAEDSIVFLLGLPAIVGGAMLFGNVSLSIFARNTVQKVDKLLARFSEQS